LIAFITQKCVPLTSKDLFSGIRHSNRSLRLISQLRKRRFVSIPLISGDLLLALVKAPAVANAGCEPPLKRPLVVAVAGCEGLPRRPPVVVVAGFEPPLKRPLVVAGGGFGLLPKRPLVVVVTGFEPPLKRPLVVADGGFGLLPKRPPVVVVAGFEPPLKRPLVVAGGGFGLLPKRPLVVVVIGFEPPLKILLVVADGGFGLLPKRPPVVVVVTGFEPPLKRLFVVADGGFGLLLKRPLVVVVTGFEPPLKRLFVVADGGFGLLPRRPPVVAVAGCEPLSEILPPPFCAGVLEGLWLNPENGRGISAAVLIDVTSGLVPVVVEFPSPPDRLSVAGVTWMNDPKGLDSGNFFWSNVSKLLPTDALNPATGLFGVLGPEVAEVGDVLIELKVGNRPPELGARNELLELTVSFGGVADADRVGSGV
jgi:hypothetical protein